MRRSNRLVLLLGIVFAVAAFFGVVLLTQESTASGGASAQVPAVYAKVAIPLGTAVTADQLESRRLPADQVDPDAVVDPGLVVGKVAGVEIAAGQQLLKSDFALGSTQGSVSPNIPKGLRAVAIKVDQLSGVGTLINAGDRVDVIATFDKRSFAAPAGRLAAGAAPVLVPVEEDFSLTTVKVLIQDLLVVGTILPAPAPADGAAQESAAPALGDSQELVIVAVTPRQAEAIAFAQAQGSVALALRSPKDYVDDAGTPVVPAATKTDGVVLKTMLEEYGVLVPGLEYGTAEGTR